MDNGATRSTEIGAPLVYEPNPKHKHAPTPGRHGSLCPARADAAALLEGSDLLGRQRYGTDGTDAFCAQYHGSEHNNALHGYPIGWDEVPPDLVERWVAEGKVARRTVRRARRQRQR